MSVTVVILTVAVSDAPCSSVTLMVSVHVRPPLLNLRFPFVFFALPAATVTYAMESSDAMENASFQFPEVIS